MVSEGEIKKHFHLYAVEKEDLIHAMDFSKFIYESTKDDPRFRLDDSQMARDSCKDALIGLTEAQRRALGNAFKHLRFTEMAEFMPIVMEEMYV